MREARGDYRHLKNKKGEFTSKPLPQPTLPNLSVDDDIDDKSSFTRVAPSTYTQDSNYYYNSDPKNFKPPPMPAYNPYSTQQPPDAYATFNPSQAAFEEYHQAPYGDDESNVHLTSSAAPFSYTDRHGSPAPTAYSVDRRGSPAPTAYSVDRHGSPAPAAYYSAENYEQRNANSGSTAPTPYHNGGGNYDPRDVYQGRGGVLSPRPQQLTPPSAPEPATPGLAYDDAYGGYSPQQQQQGGWNPGDMERGRGY